MMTHSDESAPAPAWLSRTEAAAYVGVDLSTIDRRLKKGMLTRFKSGGRVRIYREELDKLFQPKKETSNAA